MRPSEEVTAKGMKTEMKQEAIVFACEEDFKSYSKHELITQLEKRIVLLAEQ
jgi:hypothetical protein